LPIKALSVTNAQMNALRISNMNEDLTLYMPSQDEIEELIAEGKLVLWFEAIAPRTRLKDHETPSTGENRLNSDKATS
jgi:hypothetical protein